MQRGNILVGYTNQDRPFEVKDYPYGFSLRTSIFYWIETKPGKGDRLGTYTINPKTGRHNAPKYSTYSTFLYLYLDEQGHVKTGRIDSYDVEDFVARFNFIIEKIGEEFISDVQKDNIRINHYQHIRGNAPYQAARYSENTIQDFKNWATATMKHIRTCEFKDLVTYPERPEEDNPEGEIKMTVTHSQIV